MSSFAISWLDLRAAADLRARDVILAKKAIAALFDENGPQAPGLAADLGAGTGATLRALKELGADDVVWRFVDKDGRLLDEALRRHGKTFIIEDHQSDLGVVDELPLAGVRLVTASALFDLASQAFIEQICARISKQRSGLYAALNYDGNTRWEPSHPLDAQVLAAFNEDQRRDKGLGAALGPDAVPALQTQLRAAGYTVELADSAWQLDGEDAELVKSLVQGIADAVAGSFAAETLAQWRNFREEHAASGRCVVGHTDLLALPKRDH